MHPSLLAWLSSSTGGVDVMDKSSRFASLPWETTPTSPKFMGFLERMRPTPRLTKPHTNCRASLEPGLKVAITLRHMASGNIYRNMQYAWRVPHNISVVVRDVVEAILEEYTDELFA
ncbi:hypothetical protein Bbelb_343450 [Branchiostoma belcheri]|nr:hypothetical protein Bbelb_343450 [Branchiostoma belcheri]